MRLRHYRIAYLPLSLELGVLMSCMGNWICFNCRIAKRLPTWRRITHDNPETIGSQNNVRCQQCAGQMLFLGPTIKIPSKSKTKLWAKLHSEVLLLRQDIARYKEVGRVKKKHAIERTIEALNLRTPNKDRKRLVREYEKHLRKYT